MSTSAFTAPLIIRDDNVQPLHRIAFDDSFREEAWLQKLLFDHPALIPFDEIEPSFRGSVAVAMEVESGSGPIDIMYVNADGLLTLVETKLWRNPESRRIVVSQLINYAASLTKMSYEELKKAISATVGSKGLLDALRASGSDLDEARFHDAVARNLKRGRFLLLIVGDGIREDVDSMAEFLQGQPRLGFTLGLVEMALFRLSEGQDDQILVQPRILARTNEITRAIVEIRGDGIHVETPPEPKGIPSSRFKITEDQFFAELGLNTAPEAVAFARWFIEHAPEHELVVEWKQAGPIFKYVDQESGTFFTLVQFDRYGQLSELSRFEGRCSELGLPNEIWTSYFDAIIQIVPKALRKHFKSKAGNEWEDIIFPDGISSLAEVMRNKAQWLDAIGRAIGRIKEAMRRSDAARR